MSETPKKLSFSVSQFIKHMLKKCKFKCLWLKYRESLIALFALATLLIGLTSLAAISKNSPVIRLEHFSFLASIVGAIISTVTLYKLVSDRNEKYRIGQADKISAWLLKKNGQYSNDIIMISNASPAPIYNVVVTIVDGRDRESDGRKSDKAFQRYVQMVPPGKAYLSAPTGYSGMSFIPAIEIAFEDWNNATWVRNGSGLLEEVVAKTTTDFYQVGAPVAYSDIQLL